MPEDESLPAGAQSLAGARVPSVCSRLGIMASMCSIRLSHRTPNNKNTSKRSPARKPSGWSCLPMRSNLFTDKSSEYIPFDQPSFVVDAIREVFIQRQ